MKIQPFCLCTGMIVLGLCLSPAAKASDVWIAELKDPAHRIDAQWNLRLEKDPKKIPGLVSLLNSEDSDLKVTALQILSETGDASLWKNIVPLLKDKDPLVRESAASALGSLGDRRALPFLYDTIMEGMNLSEATTYWVMPSDITENYRYACVEALNRLAKQDFKYTRSVNNFGRIFWLMKIKKWWAKQQAFYSGAFRNEAKAWKEHKTQIESLLASLKQMPEQSGGLQEFDARLRDLKEVVEGVINSIDAANVSTEELKSYMTQVQKGIMVVDEIFVYTPELSLVQQDWNAIRAKLLASRINVNAFL